ncbi:hypothetical protein WR25_22375 [Diploscapter pachys]|uniref:Uncharacterized protein n=1 Tax=Diploscapter pachys TaxID=2018661 RepID=A0A2A2L4V5_9BILA|nr:hypothetical protein WR25_22375 [Diploscapter pachys]
MMKKKRKKGTSPSPKEEPLSYFSTKFRCGPEDFGRRLEKQKYSLSFEENGFGGTKTHTNSQQNTAFQSCTSKSKTYYVRAITERQSGLEYDANSIGESKF